MQFSILHLPPRVINPIPPDTKFSSHLRRCLHVVQCRNNVNVIETLSHYVTTPGIERALEQIMYVVY